MKDGISWDSSSDRKSVCWPITLFCPKYSSSVSGLSESARGLPIINKLHGDNLDLTECEVDPETWLSGPTTGSDSLSKLRLIPLLKKFCLPADNPLRSFWGETLLLLFWKTENIPDGCEPTLLLWPEAVLFTEGAGGFVSELTRGFFDGGSLFDVLDCLSQELFLSRHTSRCRLMVVGVKSFRQTGHCTEAGAGDVISVAMMIAAKQQIVMWPTTWHFVLGFFPLLIFFSNLYLQFFLVRTQVFCSSHLTNWSCNFLKKCLAQVYSVDTCGKLKLGNTR